MRQNEAVKLVLSWLFILAVFGTAWQYAPQVLTIVTTAVTMAIAVAVTAVVIVTIRSKRQ